MLNDGGRITEKTNLPSDTEQKRVDDLAEFTQEFDIWGIDRYGSKTGRSTIDSYFSD